MANDIATICARLRFFRKCDGVYDLVLSQEMRALLDHIATLTRERDEAREALVPFAEQADTLDATWHDADDLWESSQATDLTAGDLRRARAVLSATQPEPAP